MMQRTRNLCAALDFVRELVRNAKTQAQWSAVGALYHEISATHRSGGDVGAILWRYNVAVPSSTPYEKHNRRPAPEPVVERKAYFVDDLLRAIAGSEGNGNGHSLAVGNPVIGNQRLILVELRLFFLFGGSSSVPSAVPPIAISPSPMPLATKALPHKSCRVPTRF